MDDFITTGEYISLLTKTAADEIEKVLLIGRFDGWLEDFDAVNIERPVTKKQICRITHQYMKLVMDIRDEAAWETAKKLVDLYDCRTCVMHIAQMYAKKIVFPKSENEFGGDDSVTKMEAYDIVNRVDSHIL